MRITTITYARLRNLGRYENERLEATAEVAEGETAEEVARYLRAWVEQQLGLAEPTQPGDPRVEGGEWADPLAESPF